MQPAKQDLRLTNGAVVSAAPGLWSTLQGFPRETWILFAGTFLNKFGTFVIPFLTLYMTRNGYSLGDAGLAIGAYGVGTLLACFLGGFLADRIGRRNTIVLSMFSAAATMLLLSQANSLWSIIALTGLNALAAELYRPASSALLTDLVPEPHRVTAFAMYRLAFNAGWAFGPATAGFLAERSFSWLFVGDAVTSALFGVVALAALPHGFRTHQKQSTWVVAMRHFRQHPAFLQVLISACLVAFAFYQLSSTYGLHVTQLGFSAAVYGALISFNGVLVVCFELPLTTLTRRFEPRRCMALGYLLVGTGSAMIIFAPSIPLLIAAMAVFTLGEIISMPVSSAYIAQLAPREMRGRYMGAFGVAWSFTLVFAPGLGMQLFSRSPALLWSMCGIAGLLAALAISAKRDRRAEPARLEVPQSGQA